MNIFTKIKSEINIIVTLIFLLLIGLFFWLDTILLKDFGLNFFTEMLGVVITVMIIDKLVQSREKDEAKRKTGIALNGIFFTLNNHIQMLANMFKASSEKIDINSYNEAKDLFNEKFFIAIQNLDFSGKAPLSLSNPNSPLVFTDTDWYYYLNYCLEDFFTDIGKNIEKYSHFYNSDTLKILEKISNNPFLNLLNIYKLEASRGRMGKKWINENRKEETKEHLESLVQLIDIFNSYSNDRKIVIDKNLFAENMAPKIGSSRLK